MNGKFTAEKAATVIRWMKNIDSITYCSHNCGMCDKHSRKTSYSYRVVLFYISINGRIGEHIAREILLKMEHHGLIFHCRTSGLVFIIEDLNK